MMSVQLKILAACLAFVVIIATLGGLAQRQAAQMGRLAISIYDHAFMGMSYIDQAQEEFLRLAATHRGAGATLSDDAGRAALKSVLVRLDVALERAASDRSRDAGKQVRALLAALPEAGAAELPKQMAQADQAITRLVKKFGADGLDARDDAEALATESFRRVLIEIGLAVCLALGVGWIVGRNLSRPLVQLVRVIDSLAAGELERELSPKLLRRRDEIGKLARATAVFRGAMAQNARAGDERMQMQEKSESEKLLAMRNAADEIERETTHVTEQSSESSALLVIRAEELAASAARVLGSAGAASQASATALERGQLVAEAGDQLAASAREIAGQLSDAAKEIAGAAQAGERARQIIDQLSTAVGQIGAVARLIGDIAGRTNLLALNATIEAARAGDAGRGFAVVATEVKALATQTAHSTAEIAHSAGAIQQATRNAVEVVGEMVGRVASIERITRVVAAASHQQTAATGEIARNVAGSAEEMRVVSAQIGSVAQEARGTDVAVAEMRELAITVGQRIADLRTVMVRIVRTSSSEANRRDAKRVQLSLPATLVANGRELPATCVNLSHGGARVRVEQALPACDRVILRLPGLPELPGQMLDGGEEFSLQFGWDAETAPPELRAWLGQRAAA
jgi:methyl-accepting chemotaxis protein